MKTLKKSLLQALELYTQAVKNKVTEEVACDLGIDGGLCYYVANNFYFMDVIHFTTIIRKLGVTPDTYVGPVLLTLTDEDRSRLNEGTDMGLFSSTYDIALPPRIELINKVLKYIEDNPS